MNPVNHIAIVGSKAAVLRHVQTLLEIAAIKAQIEGAAAVKEPAWTESDEAIIVDAWSMTEEELAARLESVRRFQDRMKRDLLILSITSGAGSAAGAHNSARIPVNCGTGHCSCIECFKTRQSAKKQAESIKAIKVMNRQPIPKPPKHLGPKPQRSYGRR